jgi:hypothetical protein
MNRRKTSCNTSNHRQVNIAKLEPQLISINLAEQVRGIGPPSRDGARISFVTSIVVHLILFSWSVVSTMGEQTRLERFGVRQQQGDTSAVPCTHNGTPVPVEVSTVAL